MSNTENLTALVGSRICHDLVNPLSAISNGVELFEMTGGGADEMALIRDSVEAANARLNFFRVAFGAAAADQSLGEKSIRPMLETMTRGTRLTIDWQVTGDIPRRDARVVFLLIQCMECALPVGGTITISPDLTVTATGRRFKIEDHLWDALRAGQVPSEMRSAQVQFGLMPACLSEAHRALGLEITEEQITAKL